MLGKSILTIGLHGLFIAGAHAGEPTQTYQCDNGWKVEVYQKTDAANTYLVTQTVDGVPEVSDVAHGNLYGDWPLHSQNGQLVIRHGSGYSAMQIAGGKSYIATEIDGTDFNLQIKLAFKELKHLASCSAE